jgi:CheY-like chemotaxis protein
VLYFANSGDQALEPLDREIEPEVLAAVSDINMPGMAALVPRRCQRQLLNRYHAELPDHGVSGYDRYARDDDYRLSVLWQFCWAF